MRSLAIALFALTGCIDEYRGSELQIDFSPATPVQASLYSAQGPGQLPAGVHFTLYAFDEMPSSGATVIGRLFEIQRFEIHRIVDLQSPCFIDVGDHVPFSGLHVSQYADAMKNKYNITDIANPPADVTPDQLIDVATAIQRQENVLKMASAEGPKVISSASNYGYEDFASSCTDPNGMPPTNCTEPEANERRLAKCQAFWAMDPYYFEGTDRVLTQPLDGKAYGMVTGTNPVNLAPVGGSAFFVDESLEDFDGFAIYWSYDDFNGDGKPDYPPSVPQSERTDLGTLYLFGRPEHPTRGVIHVHMTSLVDTAVNADLAIFANLQDDEVHF